MTVGSGRFSENVHNSVSSDATMQPTRVAGSAYAMSPSTRVAGSADTMSP